MVVDMNHNRYMVLKLLLIPACFNKGGIEEDTKPVGHLL
jgi:hypothetical protein